MTANEAYDTYRNVLISTAVDKLHVVSLLYEGALGFSKKALEAMKSGDEDTKVDSLNRVSGILFALRDSLDESIDKDVTDYLRALYNFLIQKTIDVNVSDDYEEFGIVIRYIEQLSDIWNNQVMRKED